VASLNFKQGFTQQQGFKDCGYVNPIGELMRSCSQLVLTQELQPSPGLTESGQCATWVRLCQCC
jgi:hypothetical protein